jgi:hypothetical protein
MAGERDDDEAALARFGLAPDGKPTPGRFDETITKAPTERELLRLLERLPLKYRRGGGEA